MFKKLLSLLTVSAFLLADPIPKNSSSSSSTLKEETFKLQTVDGKTIHLTIKNAGIEVKEYPDKVIILDFFGKNCPPCRIEMPILGKVQQKMKDKLQIIGIHVQRPLTKNDLRVLKSRGVNYPVCDYLASEENRRFVSRIGNLTGWQGNIPFMLFFDRYGNYAGYHLGMADEESLERFVQKLYNPPRFSPYSNPKPQKEE